MKMEAGEIISREYIKPSSPTPHDQRVYKLSLLDQIIPPFYAPTVLYYPNLENKPKDADFISQATQILKQSLSATLTRFYPLAGRIKDRLSVDCNDEGVLFVVAKFSARLSDFLKNPDAAACRGHIPSELTLAEPDPGSPVIMIQVNIFDCGGLAIGSLFFHKVLDGVTIATFLKSWAAAAAAVSAETVFPKYLGQSFFPQNEAMERKSHLFSVVRRYFKFGKTVMRRYVFDASAISTLRAKLDSPEGHKPRPTRVEVVTAFLWKCFMAASEAINKSSPENNRSKSLVTHNVNIRRKTEPPFPEDGFGNFVWLAAASSFNSEADRDLKHLFGKVRNGISKVNADFIARMQGDKGFSGYTKNVQESWSEFPENADYLSISSWCNFGFYTTDFGWGKPVWITKCDHGSDEEFPFLNILWLMDTRQGDGIEAWLTLDEKYFPEFDEIQEIRDIALFDPSPLEMAGIKLL